MKKKFKLRPELGDFRYWIHIPIIALVVLGILQIFYGGNMLTWKSLALGSLLIILGDITAHTLLRLD
jgi:hypothetical protein